VIDPAVVQNIGIRTAEVTRGPAARRVRALATVEHAQPAEHALSVRFAGWIEAMYADAVGRHVERGDPLFKVYSPQIYAAQEELLLAKDRPELAASARQRLALFGLTGAQIDAILKRGRAEPAVTLLSPFTGHINEKRATDGMRIEPGMTLYRIVDHRRVWVNLQVEQSAAAWVKPGLPATLEVDAFPGRAWEGKVELVLPHLDMQTRYVIARLVFENPGLGLRPGMFGHAVIRDESEEHATLVPRDAVIDTGARQVAFVSKGGGRFEPRQVVLGIEAGDGRVEVIEGLEPGQRVVTSGQFLLDSEANMRASLARMVDDGLPAAQTPEVEVTPAEPGRVSAEIQRRIDALARAYLAIADGLTRDTLDGAAARLETIRDAAARLSESADEELAASAAAVQEAARIDAERIEPFREAFSPLSDAVIVLLGQAPASEAVAERLHVAHCPMVDKDWLQSAPGIRNPYATYMLTCGSIERQIAAAPPPESPPDSPPDPESDQKPEASEASETPDTPVTPEQQHAH